MQKIERKFLEGLVREFENNRNREFKESLKEEDSYEHRIKSDIWNEALTSLVETIEGR